MKTGRFALVDRGVETGYSRPFWLNRQSGPTFSREATFIDTIITPEL